MKHLTHKHTIRACFAGYGIQAIINNFIPLLFVFFGNQYNIGLSEIAFLITFNFAVQLLVDVAGAFIVDKVGYRVSMVAAHFFATAGFVCLIILPDVMSSAYSGIVISVVLYAVGGGLLEVLVSPVAEACPTENKQSVIVGDMCLLLLFPRYFLQWQVSKTGDGLFVCGLQSAYITE